MVLLSATAFVAATRLACGKTSGRQFCLQDTWTALAPTGAKGCRESALRGTKSLPLMVAPTSDDESMCGSEGTSTSSHETRGNSIGRSDTLCLGWPEVNAPATLEFTACREPWWFGNESKTGPRRIAADAASMACQTALKAGMSAEVARLVATDTPLKYLVNVSCDDASAHRPVVWTAVLGTRFDVVPTSR